MIDRYPGVRIHPSALVEDEVEIGEGTSVWDGVHIRRQARIGRGCIVGEKTYIAYDVVIGNLVKLNASVYICAGVTIEDGVMIAAHTVFTNDRYPRAGNLDLNGLETSDPTDETLAMHVGRGVTIGANATIGPGVTLGAFSMVGMGSVVTKSIAPHRLVVGAPARPVAWVCACGHPIFTNFSHESLTPPNGVEETCSHCQRGLRLDPKGVKIVRERVVS